MNRREFSCLAVGAALGSTSLRAFSQTMSPPGGQRFSVMLWALAKQAPFDQCLQWVADAGYQGVELVGEFQKWSPEKTRQTMARIRSLNLIVDAMSGVKAAFCDPSQSAAFKTQFTAQIEAAKRLECPQIILTSGSRVAGMAPEIQRQTSVENLQHAADAAAKENLQVVIEPIDPLENPTVFLTTVADAFPMVQQVGRDNVKVLYDFYHEQRNAGNLIEKLSDHVSKIGLVHVADVPGRHEPGTGELDYQNIYRKLAELRYEGFIAMEFYPVGDPVSTLTKARLEAQQAMQR